MTKNQIEYQKLVEMRRANLANEALTHWRDRVTAKLRGGELGETSFHNRMQESEAQRHNKAVEYQSLVSLGIAQQQADVAKRSAEIAKQNADTNWYNAETNRINSGTNQYVARTGRINAMTQQSALQESIRSNRAQELLSTQRNELTQQQIDVSSRQTDIADRRATIESGVAASQIDLNRSKSAQVDTQTSYLGQENTRGWIDTLSGGVRNLADTVAKLIPLE